MAITIDIDTARPYQVHVGTFLLEQAGPLVRATAGGSRAVIVTDTNVGPLYQMPVKQSLEAAGYTVSVCTFEAGEAHKRAETYINILEFVAEHELSRSDVIVALGGGVVGDVAGFVAATYMRGCKFVQIPTSLLAMVDSSVGGKTGVDLPYGKNLVGAFHQPIAVLIDPDTLSTLSDKFICDGMAEVIKYGCIKDAKFFQNLADTNALDHIEDVIETCVSIKRDVVNRDEKEKGERMLLNFGHTLGHSIEKLYNFKGITHGMAVAIGMVLIAKAGENQGITESGTADEITAVCHKYGLPTTDKASFAEMANAAKNDKKASGNSINLVLLNKIGDSFTQKIELDKLKDFITT